MRDNWAEWPEEMPTQEILPIRHKLLVLKAVLQGTRIIGQIKCPYRIIFKFVLVHTTEVHDDQANKLIKPSAASTDIHIQRRITFKQIATGQLQN